MPIGLLQGRNTQHVCKASELHQFVVKLKLDRWHTMQAAQISSNDLCCLPNHSSEVQPEQLRLLPLLFLVRARSMESFSCMQIRTTFYDMEYTITLRCTTS